MKHLVPPSPSILSSLLVLLKQKLLSQVPLGHWVRIYLSLPLVDCFQF